MEEGKVEWESDITFSLSLSPSYRVNESHVFHFIPIVSSRLQYTCLFSVTRERNSLLSKFLSVLRVNCGEISRSMRCVLLFPAEISRGTRKNWQQASSEPEKRTVYVDEILLDNAYISCIFVVLYFSKPVFDSKQSEEF